VSGRLVLLHGFTGSPASWDDVVARLDAEIDVFRPTLTGHDPDYVPDTYDAPASFGEEVFGVVAEILAGFGAQPMHLAGYSLGARVALMMIATAPDLFASATLIGVNPGVKSDAERAERRAADARWIELLEDGIEPFVDAWERIPLWHTQARLPAQVRAAQREARLRHDPRGLALSLRIAGLAEQPDLRPRLADVQVPVTLMAGAEDPKFTALAEETAALLPHARVVVVPEAGHNLLLERPQSVADELNRMIS
jgi:2-succinyl-6-hydroxy-2,4-cyclohexadiene-1-carboxylate synthase